MEPEVHRLDREAMLADRLAAAARVQREVDDAVGAAAEKRNAYLEWFVNHMWVEARAQRERERLWADLRVAGGARKRKPAEITARRSDWWEDVQVEPAPVIWAATG